MILTKNISMYGVFNRSSALSTQERILLLLAPKEFGFPSSLFFPHLVAMINLCLSSLCLKSKLMYYQIFLSIFKI